MPYRCFSAVIVSSTAWLMSVSRPPASALARPAHIDRSVTSSSAASSAEGSPTVTVVAEEVRHRALGPDVVLGDGVELPGADAGADGGPHRPQRSGGDEARGAH